ncbi:hypothetical protein GCM10010214_25610 [Streptomyces abikoensis]|nr:hypothetical protein GCM10010214_25610 [Streptomyces abikoensis]
MHPHQVVAQLGPLHGAVGELPQLDEQGAGAAAVVRIPVLVALPALVLIHVVRPVVRPFRWVAHPLGHLLRRRDGRIHRSGRVRRGGRIEVFRIGPGRLLRDGRSAHSPR